MSLLVMFLFVVAAVLFLLSAFGLPTSRINLVAAGLFCWVLGDLLMKMPPR